MDRRSFSGVSGRLGIVSDSLVQLSLSDTGPCWSSAGSVGTYYYCLSWVFRWSFRSSFATSLPALMPSQGLMFWARCYHIPWTLRMASCLQKGVPHSSYIDGILLFPAVFLRWVTVRYHLIQRMCSTVPYVLLVVVRCHPVVY